MVSKLWMKVRKMAPVHKLFFALVLLNLALWGGLAGPWLANVTAGERDALSAPIDDANPPLLSFRVDQTTGVILMFNPATGQETVIGAIGTATGNLIHVEASPGEVRIDVPEGTATDPARAGEDR